MPCYRPIKRYVIGVDQWRDLDVAKLYPAYITVDGHREEVRCLVRYPGGELAPWTSDDPPPYPDNDVFFGKLIRCGTCEGCRMDKSRDWANRLLLEREYWSTAYFVTLTYDDDHVPRSYYADPRTGEAQPSLTLCKKDLQDFLKRLRYHHKKPLKFFACGEYGPQTFRPHYHLIIFGLELGDLVPYAKNELGQWTYQSNWLTSIWAERKAPCRQGSVTPLAMDPEYFCTPYGRVLVAEAEWKTFAYVSRYTTKKLYGPQAKYYEQFNIIPPFLQMSLKPAIGRRWFDDHPDVMDFEYINVSTPTGGKKFRPPYYFDQLYDCDDDGYDRMSVIKLDRQLMAEEAKKAKLAHTTLSYGDLLELEESQFRARMKALKRKDV